MGASLRTPCPRLPSLITLWPCSSFSPSFGLKWESWTFSFPEPVFPLASSGSKAPSVLALF